MMFRFIGLVALRAIYHWRGAYYVNPVPCCGGVVVNDPHFPTLCEAYAFARSYA